MLILIIIPIGLNKIPAITEAIAGYERILNISRYLLILSCLFLGVSSLYYVIPNAKLNYKDLVPGAALTVFLWIISGHLLSEYIIYYNQLSVGDGALGSVILTLLFFYIINITCAAYYIGGL